MYWIYSNASRFQPTQNESESIFFTCANITTSSRITIIYLTVGRDKHSIHRQKRPKPLLINTKKPYNKKKLRQKITKFSDVKRTLKSQINLILSVMSPDSYRDGLWVLNSGLEKHTLVYHYTSVRVVSSGWETICVRKLFWSIENHSGNKTSRYASLLEVTKQTPDHKPSVRVEIQFTTENCFEVSRTILETKLLDTLCYSKWRNKHQTTNRQFEWIFRKCEQLFLKICIENYSENKASRYASLLEVTKKSISVYILVSSSKFSKKANSFFWIPKFREYRELLPSKNELRYSTQYLSNFF